MSKKLTLNTKVLLCIFILCIIPQLLFAYDFGLPYAYNESEAYLMAEYEEWKEAYITSAGAGVGLRVRRDGKSDFDTVSEGMAYGMLITLYFDDQATFDDLYLYAQSHFISAGRLMHWKVDQDNNEVSEFRIKNPHDPAYLFIGDPADLDNMVWKVEDQQRYYIDGTKYSSVVSANPTEFVKAAQYGRSGSSASDADVDIAGALVFAHYKWGSTGAINYLEEAALMIKDIIDYDTSGGFLKNGNAWGDSSAWNPSYFTPAWFNVYAKFMADFETDIDAIYSGGYTAAQCIIDCNDVNTTMFDEINIINSVNGPEGLYPDWADTSSGVDVVKSNGSDRRYYLDEDGDGLIDDQDHDGDVEYDDAYRMMSFNYYYDAVRIPWRQAVMYSWYGDSNAEAITKEIGEFFKGKVSTLVDGYDITGGPWVRDDRDGFNDGDGGLYHTVTFIAMNACASLAGMDASYALDFYNEVKDNKELYSSPHHYYGNTARLLSLLYLSGRFINYAEKPAVDLGFEYCSYQTNTWNNTISVNVRVYNNGSDPVDISDINVKYWYTYEGSSWEIVDIDWAGISPGGIGKTWNTHGNINSGSFGSQNRELVISFDSGAGTLAPGHYMEAKLRVHHNDWSNYNQSNDYSFRAQNWYSDWDKICVYYDGSLVHGVQP